jgi:hypothetical protein
LPRRVKTSETVSRKTFDELSGPGGKGKTVQFLDGGLVVVAAVGHVFGQDEQVIQRFWVATEFFPPCSRRLRPKRDSFGVTPAVFGRNGKPFEVRTAGAG